MTAYLKLVLLLLVSTLVTPARAISVNSLAPPIEGVEINQHRDITLQDYLGKVLLIDFWATWCIPCRRSLPKLNVLRNRFKHQGFEIVAINLDKNSTEAQHFLHRYPVQYPVLINVSSAQLSAYQIETLPVSYLIDKNGKIIERFVGFKQSHLKKIEAFLLNQ